MKTLAWCIFSHEFTFGKRHRETTVNFSWTHINKRERLLFCVNDPWNYTPQNDCFWQVCMSSVSRREQVWTEQRISVLHVALQAFLGGLGQQPSYWGLAWHQRRRMLCRKQQSGHGGVWTWKSHLNGRVGLWAMISSRNSSPGLKSCRCLTLGVESAKT